MKNITGRGLVELVRGTYMFMYKQSSLKTGAHRSEKEVVRV